MGKKKVKKPPWPGERFGDTKYHFCMNRHFRGSEEAVRLAIRNWIEEKYDLECFHPTDCIDLEYAPLSQLDARGHRVAKIHPDHPLWDFLDDESQEAQRRNKSQNYLIWKGDPRKD